AARGGVFAGGWGGVGAEVPGASAEVGRGVTEVIRQTAERELGPAEVTVLPATTASVGSAGSASASRMTWMAAGAVQLVCREAMEELRRRGGTLDAGDAIDIERVFRHPPTRPLDPPTRHVTSPRAHVALARAPTKGAAAPRPA